jgi:hypothetical protein
VEARLYADVRIDRIKRVTTSAPSLLFADAILANSLPIDQSVAINGTPYAVGVFEDPAEGRLPKPV